MNIEDPLMVSRERLWSQLFHISAEDHKLDPVRLEDTLDLLIQQFGSGFRLEAEVISWHASRPGKGQCRRLAIIAYNNASLGVQLASPYGLVNGLKATSAM